MKIMISQPMRSKTEKQIREDTERVIEILEKQGHEVVDTIFAEEPPKNCDVALYYLSKSIEAISKVDGLVFMPGYENARGCQIEHMCAVKYGKFIKYIE